MYYQIKLPKKMLKRILNKILRLAKIKFQLVSTENISFFRNLENTAILYSQLDQKSKELIAPFMPYSRSQLAQDLFALAFTNSLEPKFFVEFGATDGVDGSNTWLLEKKLGWEGIVAEPAKIWHESLFLNRSCSIETKCIAKDTGKIYEFLEVCNSEESSPTLSTLKKFSRHNDWAKNIRVKNFNKYKVETLSLDDLLKKYKAPYEIQFLSIDTEGSELDILKGYSFRNHKIKSICVEHNNVDKTRKLIFELLKNKGYERVLEKVSKFDDWYLLKED